MLDRESLDVVDVAVPPSAQPALIRKILAHPHAPRGILAQKPLAMSLEEAKELVQAARRAQVALQVNQNMRHDQSVRALKGLLDQGVLGDPVLATIEMRAIPHWMPWAHGGRSLTTFLMSIHHIDTFRYWLGDPARVLASSRRDPRTPFDHTDGINLYIFEYDNGARASAWDDVWAGPVREGAAADIAIRWRFEGTRGLARGTIGWPGWPERVPSTIDYTTVDDDGAWHSPRWPEAWFPDAFAGPMLGLLHALETGAEPDISGRDNLRTLALCEAVLRSAREHRVTVPHLGAVSDRAGNDPDPVEEHDQEDTPT
jgi:predicted dehydrogenase